MTESSLRLPNEVAAQLQVSPSTLRRWSEEFADFLSDSAGRPQPAPGSRTAHRRYTDHDLETLMTIKGLLAEGLSYIQVGKRLEMLRLRQRTSSGTGETGSGQPGALAPSLLDASPVAPAITVLADTLHTVAEGQHLLLGSQQANRDLLTVVLQDNFSLKEENAKLRDRMLELEREISELRRQDSIRREAMEARLQKLEQQQSHQSRPQGQRRERSGCLGQFFTF